MLLKFFDQETGMLELFSLLGCGKCDQKNRQMSVKVAQK